MPAISPILILISLGIGIAINVLFCLSLIKTLSFIKEENRKISPSLIWLLLIPFLNNFWNFVVAVRMSQSIKNELESRNFEFEGNPTLVVGLLYSVLAGLVLFIPTPQDLKSYSIGISILGIVVIICFAQYWLKINWYRNILKNDTEDSNPLQHNEA